VHFNRRHRAAVIATIFCFILGSCTTMRETSVADIRPPHATVKLEAGRNIVARMRNGRTVSFRLASFAAVSLTGTGGEHILLGDIEKLEVERPDARQTGRVVVEASLVAAALLALLAIEVYSDDVE
jgi:hypothetical protein